MLERNLFGRLLVERGPFPRRHACALSTFIPGGWGGHISVLERPISGKGGGEGTTCANMTRRGFSPRTQAASNTRLHTSTSNPDFVLGDRLHG